MILGKEQVIAIIKNKRNIVFLLFVLATLIFWLLNRLSDSYIQEVSYKVEYTDLPNRFVFQDAPQEKINISVEASGFYFFSRAFAQKELDISLKNIKRKNKYSYFLLDDELDRQVKEHLKDRIRVLGVVEDSLLVNLGIKSYKKVPVISHVNLKFNTGYRSFEQVLEPDSIEVSGPEMQVSKINHIDLTTIAKEEVNKPINEKVAIVKTKYPKITYKPNSVNLHISVEKITEKTLEVPVTVINAPKEEIVIYPKKIKISCQVKLSEFNKITPKDFLLICDYNKRKDKYLEVELAEKTVNVSAVKIAKDKVEYLILK